MAGLGRRSGTLLDCACAGTEVGLGMIGQRIITRGGEGWFWVCEFLQVSATMVKHGGSLEDKSAQCT